MQRFGQQTTVRPQDQRHIDHCSLFLDTDLDTEIVKLKQTSFVFPSDLYRAPVFCTKEGICIEKLVCIMQSCLEGMQQERVYFGCAIQLLLREFAGHLTYFVLGEEKKREMSCLVEKISRELKSSKATGSYMPAGIYTMKFVSDVEEGGIRVRLHYDPTVIEFGSELAQCMSPIQFLN